MSLSSTVNMSRRPVIEVSFSVEANFTIEVLLSDRRVVVFIFGQSTDLHVSTLPPLLSPGLVQLRLCSLSTTTTTNMRSLSSTTLFLILIMALSADHGAAIAPAPSTQPSVQPSEGPSVSGMPSEDPSSEVRDDWCCRSSSCTDIDGRDVMATTPVTKSAPTNHNAMQRR